MACQPQLALNRVRAKAAGAPGRTWMCGPRLRRGEFLRRERLEFQQVARTATGRARRLMWWNWPMFTARRVQKTAGRGPWCQS